MLAQDDVDMSEGGADRFVRDLGHFPNEISLFTVAQSGFEVALDERHVESPLSRACFRCFLV